MRHHVVLVPGFFGFISLGGIAYFHGVGAVLERALAERGIEATVHSVGTYPTASIRHRAAQVLDALAAIAERDDAPIHLIGHSTGGLDARLAIAPTASLPTQKSFAAYDRVKTLVTVATPHYGTPLASAASSAMGRPLLRAIALSAVFALRRGHLPLRLAFKAGWVWNRLDDYVGLKDTVLDRLYEDLLADFTSERQQQVIELVMQMAGDQSLVLQLSAAGCDLLNAGTGDPVGVRYGSVATRRRPFSLLRMYTHGINAYAQWMNLVLGATGQILAHTPNNYCAPLNPQQGTLLFETFGEALTARDNDGLVPTLSQVWGTLIHAVDADHLDVVGHFPGPQRADFIPSESRFDEAEFERLWRAVAAFLVGDAG